jgi:hypothetical protein
MFTSLNLKIWENLDSYGNIFGVIVLCTIPPIQFSALMRLVFNGSGSEEPQSTVSLRTEVLHSKYNPFLVTGWHVFRFE